MAVKLVKEISRTEVINVQERKLLIFAAYYCFSLFYTDLREILYMMNSHSICL